MTTAIIFVPANVELDSIHVRAGMEHIARHGYELLTFASDWDVVLQLLRLHRAEVVVFTCKDHWDSEWTPRVEFVGEETQEMVRLGRSRPRNDGPGNTGDGRNRRPRITS